VATSQPPAQVLIVPSGSHIIRRFVTERIAETQAELSQPQLRDEAVAWLLSEPEVLQRFLLGQVGPIVYSLVQSQVARTRPDLMLLGTDVVPRANVKARGAKRWEQWLEHSGGRHVRAMLMSRSDCFQAAAERMLAADRSLILAKLWRGIGDALEEGECVGDKFTEQDLEDRLQQLAATRLSLTTADRTWASRLRLRNSDPGSGGP
jgi:hypothetical protein